MNKPRVGQIFKDQNEYWSLVDKHTADTGTFPDWAFNFISVHKPWSDNIIKSSFNPCKHIFKYGYSMVSPLCLVDKVTAARPDWEEDNYATKQTVVNAARQLARMNDLFVVVCN
jgi:hypothetical protein